MISSIKMRIKGKKMKLLDAFRLFDYNHDGILSCGELYGGLEWLGMKLTPENITVVVLLSLQVLFGCRRRFFFFFLHCYLYLLL